MKQNEEIVSFPFRKNIFRWEQAYFMGRMTYSLTV
jgi:hypothetical protein